MQILDIDIVGGLVLQLVCRSVGRLAQSVMIAKIIQRKCRYSLSS